MKLLVKYLEDPVRFARIKRWFYLGLVAIALAEFLLPVLFHLLEVVFNALDLSGLAKLFHIHRPHFWFEYIPAWGSLYGFVSCVVIIVVSKYLGKVWLMRREDYYDS